MIFSFKEYVIMFLNLLHRKFEVPFNSSREAEIARNSLQVDPEPRRGGSKKSFALKDNILCV